MVRIRQVDTNEDYDSAIAIQLAVFTDEQGIPRATCMEDNQCASHVLAFDGVEPVATARITCDKDDVAEIARVAVLPSHRRTGIGRNMVVELEAMARHQGAREIVLHPHRYLEAFYARLGYTRQSDTIDMVGGHDLITMTKFISS